MVRWLEEPSTEELLGKGKHDSSRTSIDMAILDDPKNQYVRTEGSSVGAIDGSRSSVDVTGTD
jgi:hypothetical protein